MKGINVRETAWKWRCKLRPHQEISVTSTQTLDLSTSETEAIASVPESDPAFGIDPSVKTFFEGPDARLGSYDWVDYPPRQLSKSAAKAHNRVAIITYKIKDKDKPAVSGCAPLKYHKIEIQSPLLVSALAPIVKKDHVVLEPNSTASFMAPFAPLWFGQHEIRDLYNSIEQKSALKQQLQLLIRLMDDMFAELKLKQKHLKSTGLVDFKSAWALFPKDGSVYTRTINSDMLLKIDDRMYCEDHLLISGKCLAFNGKEFTWETKIVAIPGFTGYKSVEELGQIPFGWLPNAAAIKARCVARGKKMLDLQGVEYRCYSGIGLEPTADCKVIKHNVEGRVLVDAVGYNKFCLSQGQRELEDPETKKNRAIQAQARANEGEPVPESDGKPKVNPNRVLTTKEQRQNKEELLGREDDLAFSTDIVKGYALRNKEWLLLNIEDIEPMAWNAEAFSHLVYDEGQKDLVLSFVENHTSGASEFKTGTDELMQDVIVGKGQGLITLLSGPPGTGKTLTAEAVADRTKRPLFHLHAEDLGINASTLGANLKRVFEMAIHWDAVVLLDEADVFMAERSPSDIHRNELVSIFLRELEYFRGILFLTTNLYHAIDTAFRSRVSMHLLFPALTKKGRAAVWRNFLERLPPIAQTEEVKEASSKERAIDEQDIKDLCLWQLNGREIKNSVQMAHSWCKTKGYILTLERAQSGIKVTAPHASKEGEADGLYE